MKLLNNLRIGAKLPLVMLLIGAMAVLLAGAIADHHARRTVGAAGAERLLAVAESRAAEVERILASVRADIRSKMANPVILEAGRAFVTSWRLFGPGVREALREAYGAGGGPSRARERSAYWLVHQRFHPFFEAHLEARNYADIYLISREGDVVYSATKGPVFAGNLRGDALRETGLAAAFETALRGSGFTEDAVTGFAPFAPEGGAPSAFMAVPVRSGFGTVEAVLAYRLTATDLTEVMRRRSGLGRTGEAMLVGADRPLRTAPAGPGLPGAGGAADDPAGRALAGLRGVMRYVDPGARVGAETDAGPGAERGEGVAEAEAVLAAHVPLRFQGLAFAVVAQQQEAEILAPARVLRAQMARDGTSALALVSVLGLWLARSMSVPLTRVDRAMARVAERASAEALPERARGDEIGMIARRLDAFRASLLAADGLARENAFKRAAFEAASAPLMLTDADLTIIYVNARAEALLAAHRIAFSRLVTDFDPAAMPGRSLATIYPGAERARAALADAARHEDELRLGQSRLRIDMGRVVQSDGTLLGYVAEWTDVTEEQLNRVVLGVVNAQLPVAGFSADGRLLEANPLFADWVGRAPDDLPGRRWEHLFPGACNPDWRTARAGARGDAGIALAPRTNAPRRLMALREVADGTGPAQRLVLTASDPAGARADGAGGDAAAAPARRLDAGPDGRSRPAPVSDAGCDADGCRAAGGAA